MLSSAAPLPLEEYPLKGPGHVPPLADGLVTCRGFHPPLTSRLSRAPFVPFVSRLLPSPSAEGWGGPAGAGRACGSVVDTARSTPSWDIKMRA